jgi:hypothetical protein
MSRSVRRVSSGRWVSRCLRWVSDSFADGVRRGVQNRKLGRLLLENLYGRNIGATGDEQACYNSQSANGITESLQNLLARG